MKIIYETLISEILFVIMIYTCCVFGMTEMQKMSARHIHTSVINQIQSSYYQVDINKLNEKLKETYPTWSIESTVINSHGDRQDRLVTLKYTIQVPLFDIEKKGIIDGYAR